MKENTVGAYRCPRPACDEQNGLKFANADERADHLINVHGEEYAEVESFDHLTDCHLSEMYTDGTGRCGQVDPCRLRCHIRWLDGHNQPNDWLADQENAEAWRRYYDANPGSEEASRAACDPKTYEEEV